MPFDEERKVFLQQDGFLDKELMPADKLPAAERPINQHWSWDRILGHASLNRPMCCRGSMFSKADMILRLLNGILIFMNR